MDIASMHQTADLLLYIGVALLGVKFGIDAYCLFRGFRISKIGIAATLFAAAVIVVTVATFHPDFLASAQPALYAKALVVGFIVGGGLTYIFADPPTNDKKED